MAQDLSNFIPEIWSKKILVGLNKNSVMKNLVNTNYEGEIKSYGDTVKIRSFDDIEINDYNGTVIETELQSPMVTLLIDQKKQFAFKVDDVSKAQSDVNIIAGYTDKAKIGIDLAKDARLLSHVVDVDAANVIATSQMTADNAYDKFVELNKILKKNNVTAAQKPYVVINPDLEAVVIKSLHFTQAGELGEKTLTEGAIGKIAGLEVFVSNNMEDVAGTYTILASHKGAITMASQIVEVESIRSQTAFATIVRGLYVFGTKLLKPKEAAVLTVTL